MPDLMLRRGTPEAPRSPRRAAAAPRAARAALCACCSSRDDPAAAAMAVAGQDTGQDHVKTVSMPAGVNTLIRGVNADRGNLGKSDKIENLINYDPGEFEEYSTCI
jgi:hypothetical protein